MRPSNHRLGGKEWHSQKKTVRKEIARNVIGSHFTVEAIQRKWTRHIPSPESLAVQPEPLPQCAEYIIALAVVAETYGLQDQPRWFRDTVDSIALYWAAGSGGPHCALLDQGRGPGNCGC